MIFLQKKFITVLAALFGLVCFAGPAAAQTAEKTILNLSEIQSLVLDNSRQLKTMDINVDSAEKQYTIAEDNYDNLRLSRGPELYDQKQVTGSTLAWLEAKKEAEEASADPDQALISSYDLQISLTQQSLIDLQIQSFSLDGSLDAMDSSKDSAEDSLEDMEQMQAELEKQILTSVSEMVFNTIETEDSINALQKQHELNMMLLRQERLKEELGMSTSENVDSMSVAAVTSDSNLDSLKNTLEIMKRTLNDAMGREPDTQLEITRYDVAPGFPAPSYESLIDDVREKAYAIYQAERQLKRLEDEYDDTDGSLEEGLVKNQISVTELSLEDEISSVENNLKTSLADYSGTKRVYTLAGIDYDNAKKEMEWAGLRYDLGMISSNELKMAEIQYLGALGTYHSRVYDFEIARQKLELAKEGIFM